ncbi:glucose-6-phosphate dehydrogenase (NADP(+)) [Candidatus Saccharibacteria bacterium]|nr:glucose-6-phosphate dehydrogenase (NADP(+)) [Candidatus Saccharibacteria bacterium]
MLPPTVLVIFGITGDLSRRYLLPALTAIKQAGQLPEDFKVIGVSRRQVQPSDILDEHTRVLAGHLGLVKVNAKDPADYQMLGKEIEALGSSFKTKPQIILYLTIPPQAVASVVKLLGAAGLNGPNVKLLLEKPFGTDLNSASELVAEASKYYQEDQVYRIDHYLAKEVAQNITVFLGTNTLFRNVWSGEFIEKIEIIAAEKIGIEDRGELWESTGTLRDFVQSHLLQLAALTLMEPCRDVFDIEQVSKHRLKALKLIEPVQEPDKVFAAQYQSYQSHAARPHSKSETFISLTLNSNDERWKGVPIHLITGKKLNEKLTEIRIYFKKSQDLQSNLLVLRIQPKEGIELDLCVKKPGYERKLQQLSLSFSYGQHFGKLPDAYEQVLVDAMTGTQGLFASSQEVLTSWKILQPVLDYWKTNKHIATYKDNASVEEILVSKVS